LQAIVRRPEFVQIGALCYRVGQHGPDVLLITTRGTGRWTIPKGWPIKGKDSAGTALQEAWEEAGIREGKCSAKSIGSYSSSKEVYLSFKKHTRIYVYLVSVTRVKESFPESHERTLKWQHHKAAANMVDEPELRDFLFDLDKLI